MSVWLRFETFERYDTISFKGSLVEDDSYWHHYDYDVIYSEDAKNSILVSKFVYAKWIRVIAGVKRLS